MFWCGFVFFGIAYFWVHLLGQSCGQAVNSSTVKKLDRKLSYEYNAWVEDIGTDRRW